MENSANQSMNTSNRRRVFYELETYDGWLQSYINQVEMQGEDVFFKSIDYEKPVVMSVDLRYGRVDRVKNDDTYSPEESQIFYKHADEDDPHEMIFDLKSNYEGFRPAAVPMEEPSQMEEEKLDFLKNLVVLAIKRFNQMNGTRYRCLALLKATGAPCNGYLYFITFIAAQDECLPQMFQANVGYLVVTSCRRSQERRVLFCRLRPNPPSTSTSTS